MFNPHQPSLPRMWAAELKQVAGDLEPAALSRRIMVGDVKGVGHGMLNADRVASRGWVALRYVVLSLIGRLPGTRFKSRLIQRLFHISMGEDVGLACGVYLDSFAPSLISFGSNVIIGYETKIFVHAFTLNRQRVKPVRIGNNVMIGAMCLIAPGVTIGDGASIAPATLVSRDVPRGAYAYGNPMQIRKRVIADQPVDAAAKKQEQLHSQ